MNVKTAGGMTRGRDITNSTLTTWVHTAPCCVTICNALERFTGVHTATSEQHRDLHSGTSSRDNKDRMTFEDWPQVYASFSVYEPKRLVSLSTGIVAGASVSCDNVVEIGLLAASKMDDKNFTDIKLNRKDKVITIGANNRTVKIRRQKTKSIQLCCSTESHVLLNPLTAK